MSALKDILLTVLVVAVSLSAIIGGVCTIYWVCAGPGNDPMGTPTCEGRVQSVTRTSEGPHGSLIIVVIGRPPIEAELNEDTARDYEQKGIKIGASYRFWVREGVLVRFVEGDV